MADHCEHGIGLRHGCMAFLGIIEDTPTLAEAALVADVEKFLQSL